MIAPAPIREDHSFMRGLIDHWVYGGFLSGLLLLTILPVMAWGWDPALAVIFLQLPVYMIHQFEEHHGDRFREYVNRLFGAEVLSKKAVFVINVPGVWGVIALAFVAARCLGAGWGLLAIYLPLINALIHGGQAIRLRQAHPGLITAITLFLPVTIFALLRISSTGQTTPLQHLTALITAVGIHVGIVVFMVRRKRSKNFSK